MLATHASALGTDTRVLGAKPKHCLHHDKPHKGTQGKKGRKTSSDHTDSAYDPISKANQKRCSSDTYIGVHRVISQFSKREAPFAQFLVL